MSKLFVNIGLSLDGYMAPEGMTMEHWDKPEYKNWGAKWGALMRWIFNQQYFRENLKLGSGGETGPVNDMLRNTTQRIGANIMGKRMFDQGERAWPEVAPFHTPVYVLILICVQDETKCGMLSVVMDDWSVRWRDHDG